MTPVSPTRVRRAERTREQILRAGLKVFSEKGFHGATMDDIALELDATKGLLYYHFKTKEDILRAITANNPIITGVENLLAAIRDMSLREGLESAFRSVRALLEANKELVRFLHIQSALSGSEAKVVYTELRQRIYHAAAELIRARQKTGDIRADLGADDLAKFVVDFLTFEFISDADLGMSHQREPYIAQVIDVIVSGIARAGAAGAQRRQRLGKKRGRHGS